VWRYLRAKHQVLGARVARYLGVVGSIAPPVLEEEVDEAAHDATATALRRVRQNAAKFDSTRGGPTQWVIGSAEYAYIDVAKEIVNARRSDALKFMDPAELLDVEDPNQTTEEHVLRQLDDAETLANAAHHLSEQEFAALRLRVTAGYSRAEAAEAIFGDPQMKKRIDGLVERGARKLAKAWADRRSSQGIAESTNFPDRTDD
jgi:DNA-directed RNA polymerase specialized sigma24 family protein